MGSYLARRFLLMIVTLIGVSVLVFSLMRVLPGNTADILFASAGFIDEVEKARIEKELGLDKPLPVQYWTWVNGLLHGDLGYSYVSERPASAEILPRIPTTLKLGGLTLLFTVLFGVPLGVISAVKQNGAVDNVLRMISISALSLPAFWIGLLVLMLFVHVFGILPIYRSEPKTWWQEFGPLVLPALVVGFRSSALVLRLTRSSMLEVLKQDYIRTARAKGAAERAINYRHALKNAVLPVFTVLGLEAAHLIGGLVVMEMVFNIPGLGRYLIDSIKVRDYPVVQTLVLFTAFATITINFIVDIGYAFFDPRIKYAD